MKVCWTLNRQKTTQNDLHFGLILLTYWFVNSVINSRVYRVYSEFIESTQSLLKK